MKQALCLCLFLFAAVAVGQQPTVTTPSDDDLVDREPVVIVDQSTGSPIVIAAWMTLTDNEYYVRTASSNGSTGLGGHGRLEKPPIVGDSAGATYAMAGDPFFAANPNAPYETYLATASCETLSGPRCAGRSDITLWESTDHGATWPVAKARSVCPQNTKMADKPSITVSKSGVLYLAHVVIDGRPVELHVHRRDNGQWSPPSYVNLARIESENGQPVEVAVEPQSPIVVVDDEGNPLVVAKDLNDPGGRIFVSWSDDHGVLFPRRRSFASNFSADVVGCGKANFDSLEAVSNLMARYNAKAKSIAIAWHAQELRPGDDPEDRAKYEHKSDINFIFFNTATKTFGSGPNTIGDVDVSHRSPGNQWIPGIDCDPDGRCLVTYYGSGTCSTDPNHHSTIYRPRASLVDIDEGQTLASLDITSNDSNPDGYRALGGVPLGMGEYQGVYYSGDKWYAAFIEIFNPPKAATTGAPPRRGDVYVAEVPVPPVSGQCTLSVNPLSPAIVEAEGGELTFTVNMSVPGCTTW